MAYPPSALATNRSNATPQTNTHPADHNAVNGAVNDIVAELGTDPGGGTTVTARLSTIESAASSEASTRASADATEAAFRVAADDALNARATWLRDNANTRAVYTNATAITTNGSGDFTINLGFSMDISAAFPFVIVNDTNVGAWAVINGGTQSTITGRLFSAAGAVASLTVGVIYQMSGPRITAYP